MTFGDDLAEPPAPRPGDVAPRVGQRILASTTSVVGSNLVVAALGIISVHQMAHTLGKSVYGDFVIALAFSTVAALICDLGVNTYTGREIAKDHSRAAEILGMNLGVRLLVSVVMVPLTIAAGQFVYAGSSVDRRLGIAIMALSLPFEALRAVSLSYYVATIQNYKTAAVNVAHQLVYVAGVVAAIHYGYGVAGCFWAYTVAITFAGLLAFAAVRREVRFAPRLVRSAFWPTLRRASSIGSIQIVNGMYLRTNVLMLSFVATSTAAGYYGVAAAVVAVLLVLPNAFMTSMIPLLVASSPDELTPKVNTSVVLMTMYGSLAVVGCACLGATVIQVLAGDEFAAAASVLSILSLSILFTAIASVLAYASFARDHHHRLLAVSGAGIVLNVALDLALIPALGARGAAVATAIVEALVLAGTYAVFRIRVGAHFTDAARAGRALLAGGLLAVLGWWWLGFGAVHTLAALAAGLVVLPVAYLALAYVLRAVPRSLGGLLGTSVPDAGGAAAP